MLRNVNDARIKDAMNKVMINDEIINQDKITGHDSRVKLI